MDSVTILTIMPKNGPGSRQQAAAPSVSSDCFKEVRIHVIMFPYQTNDEGPPLSRPHLLGLTELPSHVVEYARLKWQRAGLGRFCSRWVLFRG
jgi:hypothetical protein